MTDLASRPAAADTDAGGLESAAGTPVSEGRFPCLDGYRALAAFAVILVHVGFQTGRSVQGTGYSFLSRGDIGVPVFFVLSGFLLYRPMVLARLSGQSLPRLSDYFTKRALRIIPAYWVSVVLAMLLLDQNAAARHSAGEWIRYLTFTQIYSWSFKTVGLEQDWSLCVEVAFYLLLPLWPRLLRRLTRRSATPSVKAEFIGAAALVVVSLVWVSQTHGAVHHLSYLSANWIPEYFQWFALGMLMATISILPRTSPAAAARLRGIYDLAASPWTCVALAAAVYAVVLTPLGGPYNLVLETRWQALSKEILYGIFALIFLLPGFLGDQRVGLPRRFLASAPMRRLGEASYGIFLFHMPVLYYVFQIRHLQFPGHHFWQVLFEVVAISIPVAFFSLYVIERPAMKLKRLILRRPVPSSRAPAPDPQQAPATTG